MKNPIQLFKSVFKIEDSPTVIAKGFALGSFIGMIPIPGFQIFVAYFTAKLMKVNKKAACVAVFNTNLFTGVFIFGFNYWLGKKILGLSTTFSMPTTIDINFIFSILNAGSEVFLALVVGGCITGIIFAIGAYHIVKKIIIHKQSK